MFGKRKKMKIPKKTCDTTVYNFYERITDLPDAYNPHEIMPQHSYPVLICVGQTSSFKTNTIMNLIEKSECFTKIYLNTAMPTEPLYQYLQDCLQDQTSLDGSPVLEVSDSIYKLPKLTDEMKDQQSLLIVDDFLHYPKKVLEEKLNNYATKCRKYNMSMICISQSWYAIPKTVRLQASYVIIKGLNSKRDRKLMCKDIGIDCEEISEMIDTVQEADKKQFLMVDLKSGNDLLRYRIGFEPLIPYLHEHNIEIK